MGLVFPFLHFSRSRNIYLSAEYLMLFRHLFARKDRWRAFLEHTCVVPRSLENSQKDRKPAVYNDTKCWATRPLLVDILVL